MTQATELLTRRSAIKRLAALVGGAMTATQVSVLSKSAAALADDAAPIFFDEDQLASLERIVDIIIPETGTPGALGVGVHRFIDLMLAEWASDARQARWIDGLGYIDARAKSAGIDSFAAGSVAQQTDLLRTLDQEAFGDGNNGGFFAELKKMVVFAYYSSEVGATRELAYQAIPGKYVPCFALEDVGRAWYWNGYNYDL